MIDNSGNITIMLNQWIGGDLSIENDLINAVYPLLRDIAHKQLRQASNSGIHTTAIVNELYLKLKKQNRILLQNKNHFLAFSSKLIRNIIIDDIRSNKSLKRGQQFQHITFCEDNEEEFTDANNRNIDWLTLHNLLTELEAIDSESVKLIELRFFAGLSIPETAEVLNTSPSSISRNWKFAKSWLFNRLNDDN